jgi:hypothetical protein
MRSLGLAPILIVGTCLFLLGGAGASPLEPDLTHTTGVIALADWPFCDFLVIKTHEGFVLAMWKSGMWFFEEGVAIHGSLDQVGAHTIHETGSIMSGEMTVEIEEVAVDLRQAQKAYYRRCKF